MVPDQAPRTWDRGLPPTELDRAGLVRRKTPSHATYIEIPYRNPDGSIIKVWPKTGGEPTDAIQRRWEDVVPGQSRYTWPAGFAHAIFLPHVSTVSWSVVARDPSSPLWVTEGPFDALRATLHGAPTVGLPGVWMLGKKQGTSTQVELAPPLNGFEMVGRPVVLCFDMDHFEGQSAEQPYKLEVQKALILAGRLLHKRGASVSVAGIHLTPLGAQKFLKEKMGLDEYYAQGGTYDDLLRTCQDFSTWCETIGYDDNLAIMLSVCASINGTAVVAYTESDLPLTPGLLYSNADFKAATMGVRSKAPDGKLVLTSALWNTHPDRVLVRLSDRFKAVCDYASPMVVPMVSPGDAQGARYYVLNKAKTLLPHVPPTMPEQLVRQTILAEQFEILGQRLWGDLWYMVRGLFAYAHQYPNSKPKHHLILQGEATGTGKSLFFSIMQRCFGEAGVTLNAGDLTNVGVGKNNELICGARMVFADEVCDMRQQTADSLKPLATTTEHLFQDKFVKVYASEWLGFFCIASNRAVSIKIDTEDRRLLFATPNVPSRSQAPVEYQKWATQVGNFAREFADSSNATQFTPRQQEALTLIQDYLHRANHIQQPLGPTELQEVQGLPEYNAELFADALGDVTQQALRWRGQWGYLTRHGATEAWSMVWYAPDAPAPMTTAKKRAVAQSASSTEAVAEDILARLPGLFATSNRQIFDPSLAPRENAEILRYIRNRVGTDAGTIADIRVSDSRNGRRSSWIGVLHAKPDADISSIQKFYDPELGQYKFPPGYVMQNFIEPSDAVYLLGVDTKGDPEC